MSQELLNQDITTYLKGKFKMDEKRITIALKVANSLHQKCLKETYDVPTPVEWFLNEKKYRDMWLENENFFKNLPNDKFKEVFYQNDSYKVYLKFMHDHFKLTN